MNVRALAVTAILSIAFRRSIRLGTTVRRAAVTLSSVPSNVVRGEIPANVPPVLRVKQGQHVTIDTLSHQGLNTGDDPIAFFARGGHQARGSAAGRRGCLWPSEAAAGIRHARFDGTDLYRRRRARGPARSARDRRAVPRAVRRQRDQQGHGRAAGVAGRAGVSASSAWIPSANVALFSPEIEVPLAPFMGIMAVAPPADLPTVSSRPPGAFGGNLDLKQLTKGATLYLPVYNPGALFFTGDAHAAQGDGEGRRHCDRSVAQADVSVHRAQGQRASR
jgi:hypothetical protein